jgi:hypothetical protein
VKDIKLKPGLDFIVLGRADGEQRGIAGDYAKRTGHFAITRARYRLASILSDKQVDSEPSQTPLL